MINYTDEAVRLAFEEWAKLSAPERVERKGDGYSSVLMTRLYQAFISGMRVGEQWTIRVDEAPKELKKPTP